jgi:hypothetical protein
VLPSIRAVGLGTAWLVASSEGARDSILVSVVATPPPRPALERVTTSVQADRVMVGVPAVATIFIVGQPGATLTVLSVTSADPRIATAEFTPPSRFVVTGHAAGRTTFAVTVRGEGPGLETVERTYTVPTVVHAEHPVLGRGFGAEQFARIPAGSFPMGAISPMLDERPVRTVTITRPFLMQRTEVTRAQWRSVMDTVPLGSGACSELCPVEPETYAGVQEFLRRLNERDPGKRYRLPTEAEWEYAARAGATGNMPVAIDSRDQGWMRPWVLSLWPVALLAPNAFGLHDVLGNVNEWCSDWYSATYYPFAPRTDPAGPDSTGRRAYRGGSIGNDSTSARLAARWGGSPQARTILQGVRLVRDP